MALPAKGAQEGVFVKKKTAEKEKKNREQEEFGSSKEAEERKEGTEGERAPLRGKL